MGFRVTLLELNQALTSNSGISKARFGIMIYISTKSKSHLNTRTHPHTYTHTHICALPPQVRADALNVQVLGARHPRVFAGRSNLAGAVLSQGRAAGVLQLLTKGEVCRGHGMVAVAVFLVVLVLL